jgi:DNA excision repair protein ERCC-3
MEHSFPVDDTLGFTQGSSLQINLKPATTVREYQKEAGESINKSGNGTVVLPCGSGKTLVGIYLATLTKTSTLIVTNSQNSVKQWKNSLLKFTDISEDSISTYDANNKEIKPITITTYNMISYKKKGEFIHYATLNKFDWGLLICDEVHLLPANMFRVVASMQSSKRLALTATFVREDGREKDIFTLIGPKRYDKPWKDLENKGFISEIELQEVPVVMSEKAKSEYNTATNGQTKFEIASGNDNKIKAVKVLLNQHKNDTVLIIGQFTEQLQNLAQELNLPLVMGSTKDSSREEIYEQMRQNKINVFVASKVANAALDIPNINVVIQISSQYGSRNEEAQRIGRGIRPKDKGAFFYTLVSKDTIEETYNLNRQQFLTNEGYRYTIKEISI